MSSIRLKVNGENVELKSESESGFNLVQLLKFYRLKTEMVVIELNRQVPNKAEYATTFLKAGDEVEIVKFLGGG